MARHPWVARADDGLRFGVQIGAIKRRDAPLRADLHERPLQMLVEAGKLIESLGFDGVFLHDHPAMSPDPWPSLSAMAMVTDRVDLGSIVNCIYHRHPGYLARIATDVDNLSEGRLMLGLGIGWGEEEFRSFDIPFGSVPERQAGLEEAIQIINGVWQDEHFTFEGKYFRAEELRIRPLPVQQPRPPIMVAGGGERTTLRQVARFADASNWDSSRLPGGPDDVRRKFEILGRYCDDIGRSSDEILHTDFIGWLLLGRTQAEVDAKREQYIADGWSEYTVKMMFACTPDKLVAHYQSLAEAGMQYFIAQMHDGTDHDTLELFANKVIPRLR